MDQKKKNSFKSTLFWWNTEGLSQVRHPDSRFDEHVLQVEWQDAQTPDEELKKPRGQESRHFFVRL